MRVLPFDYSPNIVDFHREPGEIAFYPDFQLSNRNLYGLGGSKLFLDVVFQVWPPDVFPHTNRVADNVSVMSHQPRQSLQVLLSISLHQRAESRFGILLFTRQNRRW